ncbi:MAG: glutamate--tRNA ligase [Chlamydiae bacterium RIFCSPHIGHO2_12_FULL_44_59]|nr:MAG: glutamate--tRNA ligase [Chlamydiae bacterium RIFCSPHIGHO2_01_FULL_44_39]OGN60497.1 MAG: glutamate--tRNA ligase [Chlamydiae bacterium RIFCSPHIGHO2_12_FULL_44_59]OGN65951.1 MAG: glutamate--tRNA ligase [Chlamydiae bacterium RIFCSPLOWO2_01_FULL_44_52]OGN68766.1 MAG: glutamate--tRNA ligase [Chlamydiae bacterium RIFCSPLOWO2_02_FULL_45_22]OGN70407.1 MAG: glutamate--tRNA ligase [Chlamydiae bacterium RIFCSPLOWO2_12_FULL_45_20]
MTVRVRIAPSPTGDPHVGTAYIALFNLIFARHFKGQFILRIEDTDQVRSRPEFEKNILEALRWCTISWDEGPDIGGPYGPYRQSERTDIYRTHAYELLEKGMAYKCFASSEELEEMRELAQAEGRRTAYDRRYRNLSLEEVKQKEDAGQPYVIRLKIPLKGECIYEDEIKGRITVPWADVDDQVLLKSDGYPTYHLANVVDDHLMRITHVIRGDEWMSSTPKHIFLYEAFGWNPPVFMHMPLLLGSDGKKLSKRKNPTSIFYFRDSGYLPEALVNFLTLMGYSMPKDREIYELDEIIREFDPKRIGVSGAFFDVQKLEWINQKRIIEGVPESQLWDRLQQWQFNDDFMKKLMPLVHTRMRTFGDFLDLCDFFFINQLKITPGLLSHKNTAPEAIAMLLQAVIWSLDEKESWNGKALEEASKEAEEIFGLPYKKVIIPSLFASIMGKLKGPPLFDSVTLLGKDRVRVRLMKAIEVLGGISNKKLVQLKKCWEKKDCRTLISQTAAP